MAFESRNDGVNALERIILRLSPRWGASRMRHRLVAETMVRHFEAAQGGRRTDGWRRNHSDANAAAWGAIPVLRAHGRDLVRNNGWARNAVRVIPRNTVASGLRAKAIGTADGKAVTDLWRRWAGTTECDADGRLTFGGLQALVLRGVAESGEMLIRRRRRLSKDGLTIPLQLQVLEPDYIDTNKNLPGSQSGGPIIQGIELDAIGRRVAYWLFNNHPGSNLLMQPVSQRVMASEVLHVYDVERAGQARGVSWLSAAVLNLKDFDEFEDAELMKAKIAACLTAFVTDLDGDQGSLGRADTDSRDGAPLDMIGPGLVQHLRPGQDIRVVTPPSVVEGGFSVRQLRRIAATIGITYEDLTGDYSNVNFSSARMARIAFWGNVLHWRENVLAPQMLNPAWKWAMEAAEVAGEIASSPDGSLPSAEWTPPPMPLLEPDKEGLAYARMVRSGMMTPSEAARENGYDWEEFLSEYKGDLSALDAAGITLDSDARKVSQAGLIQPTPGAAKAVPAPE